MVNYNAKLGIYSEKLSAEEISCILGINHDKCWVKGAPRSTRSNKLIFEMHAWFLLSDLPSENNLFEHISRLLERFRPFKAKLAQIISECDIYINCDIEGDDNPELFFDKDIIKELAEIQANLDVDTLIAGDP